MSRYSHNPVRLDVHVIAEGNFRESENVELSESGTQAGDKASARGSILAWEGASEDEGKDETHCWMVSRIR